MCVALHRLLSCVLANRPTPSQRVREPSDQDPSGAGRCLARQRRSDAEDEDTMFWLRRADGQQEHWQQQQRAERRMLIWNAGDASSLRRPVREAPTRQAGDYQGQVVGGRAPSTTRSTAVLDEPLTRPPGDSQTANTPPAPTSRSLAYLLFCAVCHQQRRPPTTTAATPSDATPPSSPLSLWRRLPRPRRWP